MPSRARARPGQPRAAPPALPSRPERAAASGRGGPGRRGCAEPLPARRLAGAGGAMRRYLRVVALGLLCGFCSLLYAFSQLAAGPERGADGEPRAAEASWLAGGGRGAVSGAGSAGPGAGSAGPAARPARADRYGFPRWRAAPGGAGAGGRPGRSRVSPASRPPPARANRLLRP